MNKRPYLILLLITAICFFVTLLTPPTPQWTSYHHFADERHLWDISNFWNVVSNAPFFLVGLIGLVKLKHAWSSGSFSNWQEAIPFIVIFLGLMLTAIGSSYYHLAPDNYRLLWDRIPMTLVFTSFVSLVVMERMNFKAGIRLLLPLILFGVWSAWYWYWTESLGRGDLRFYGFVKIYSLVAVLLIMYLFPKPYPSTKLVFGLIAFYAIATFFEFTDVQIFDMGGVMSGHTLKHLFAAIGSYSFVLMVDELVKRHSRNVLK